MKPHIADPNFGLSETDVQTYILAMLSDVDKLSVPDAKQLMRDVYESKFGIYDHLSGPDKHLRPLASVALHFSESPVGIRNVDDLISYYINMDVKKHAGCSMEFFLALPRAQMRRVMEAVDKKVNDQVKITTAMASEANKNQHMRL